RRGGGGGGAGGGGGGPPRPVPPATPGPGSGGGSGGGRTEGPRLTRLHERTDGNAFFLEELLMAEAADPAAMGLPPTVTATLIALIAAAPEAAQRVLRVAAVAGRRVDHELLAEVAGLHEAELTDGLPAPTVRQL